MTLRELFHYAPTGMSTCLMVGVTHGAFLGLGAVYATRLGLTLSEIGLFVSIPTIGVILMSVPISAASDDIDRLALEDTPVLECQMKYVSLRRLGHRIKPYDGHRVVEALERVTHASQIPMTTT